MSRPSKELRDWTSKVAYVAQEILRTAGLLRQGEDRWAKIHDLRSDLNALIDAGPAKPNGEP